jgi:hypothetical protein
MRLSGFTAVGIEERAFHTPLLKQSIMQRSGHARGASTAVIRIDGCNSEAHVVESLQV